MLKKSWKKLHYTIFQLLQIVIKLNNLNFILMIASISKIREFLSEYRMVCESFSINITEFESIFQKDNQEFFLWDTDSNGLIDGLELFCGIILISDCSGEEKLKCINIFFAKYVHSKFKIKISYFSKSNFSSI